MAKCQRSWSLLCSTG